MSPLNRDEEIMSRRGSGILLHITSLPSPYGVGDLGSASYDFVDFLAQTQQSYWQILPLNAINSAYDISPYHTVSAFACNVYLISPEVMVRDGLLAGGDLKPRPDFPAGCVDYESVIEYKNRLFQKAFEHYRKGKIQDERYKKFCTENSSWLEDFALFMALKKHFRGKAWSDWPVEIKNRNPEAVQSAIRELDSKIEREKFLQFIFDRQWRRLKTYCRKKGIQIIGDIPIYVDYDSVSCWTYPEIFKLDKKKRAQAVAGVPPDYFSRTGQLWGNPVYRWEELKEREYDWWIDRFKRSLKLCDILRLDHFCGFVRYWEVSAGRKTAIKGKWKKVPVYDFFTHLKKKFPRFPIIAEDLGFITPEVKDIMLHFDIPGMKVLLFAFGRDDPRHPYLPHNYEENCVVYTGTHDNNTVRGWFESEAKPREKTRVFRYLDRNVKKQEIHWEFVKLAMMSKANTAIVPVQDILGLGEEARMNLPATKEGNWRWRLLPEQVTSSLARKLLEITQISGRAKRNH